MKYIFLIATFFLVNLAFPLPTQAAGPKYTLSPISGPHASNTTWQVTVGLEAGTQEITLGDVRLSFDTTKLEVTGIASGAFFQDYLAKEQDNTAGKIFISGENPDGKSGSGSVAVITFKAKSTATAGPAAVTFVCAAGQTGDSDLFGDSAQDLLDCPATLASNASYTITTTGGTTPTPTVTGIQPTPTPTTSTKAACYQSCSEDSSCQSGLVCRTISSLKRCVNVNCTGESDCDCGNNTGGGSTPTPTPTKKPTGGTGLPVTGTTENTLALMGLGVLVLLGGIALAR